MENFQISALDASRQRKISKLNGTRNISKGIAQICDMKKILVVFGFYLKVSSDHRFPEEIRSREGFWPL